MRFDLYTREDRAREALAYYRDEQRSIYMLWCIGGALIVAYAIVVAAAWFFPDYIYPPSSVVQQTRLNPEDYNGYRREYLERQQRNQIWFDRFFTFFFTLRGWVIGAIVFAIFVAIGLASAKLIAFYQGILLGLLAGGIVFLLAWGALAVLSVTKGIIIPAILGSIVGVITFASGVLGGYLPDTST